MTALIVPPVFGDRDAVVDGAPPGVAPPSPRYSRTAVPTTSVLSAPTMTTRSTGSPQGGWRVAAVHSRFLDVHRLPGAPLSHWVEILLLTPQLRPQFATSPERLRALLPALTTTPRRLDA